MPGSSRRSLARDVLKFLAHNICVLIHSQFELGIESEFWREDDCLISHEAAPEVRPLPGF